MNIEYAMNDFKWIDVDVDFPIAHSYEAIAIGESINL